MYKVLKFLKKYFALSAAILYNKLSYQEGVGWHMEYVERKRLLFFGLPWTFTKYTVKEDNVVINSGFLKTCENNCYMYKIQDVELQATLLERMFKLATVICYTGDTTHPKLELLHIRQAKEIKDYILEASEEARRKRRTLNTLDIGSGAMGGMELEDL